jgi:hypothetical protein
MKTFPEGLPGAILGVDHRPVGMSVQDGGQGQIQEGVVRGW